MAHRIQYKNDITIPSQQLQIILQLQQQIRQVKQKQTNGIRQGNIRLLMLEKRLLHGKKKIFTYDNNNRNMNRVTLSDEIDFSNKQIEKLKRQIIKQQESVQVRRQQMQKINEQNRRISTQNNIRLNGNPSFQKSQPLNSLNQSLINDDPQEQIMILTHQIIHLKKSLQEVRSKYTDNFTEYKLKQEHEKLKKQNQSLAQQLSSLQKTKLFINQSANWKNVVNYEQLETCRAIDQYSIIKKQHSILKHYLNSLQQEALEKKQSQGYKLQMWRKQKISRLNLEIQACQKNNEILMTEIQLIEDEIQRRKGRSQRRKFY